MDALEKLGIRPPFRAECATKYTLDALEKLGIRPRLDPMYRTNQTLDALEKLGIRPTMTQRIIKKRDFGCFGKVRYTSS